tara:strand:- start:312 stop:524 length:213 start_codon:yes stop_codon:yes gene_type:complete
MARNAGARTNAAMGGAYLAAGAGSGVICTPGDNSFVCQIKRLVASVQGVAFLLGVLFMIYYVIVNRKSIF